MSLTRSSPGDKQLRKFFKEKIVPEAEQLRRDGVELMPLGSDDDAETWYVPYPPDTPEFVEFESTDCEPQLRRLWEVQGLSQLMGLVEPLADLARRLEQPPPEDAEVSPFIYVIF